MTKIIQFPGLTRRTTPVLGVLQQVAEMDLQSVVMVGWDRDGNFKFASSSPDGGEALTLLQIGAHELLQAMCGGMDDPPCDD